MNIENYLSETLAKVFQKLGYAESFAKVVTSTREDVGHFQCNGAMPLAKFAKKPPLAIAEEIVEHIDAEDIFAKLEVAKPGFINITLAPKFLADTTNRFLNSNKFGVQNNLPNRKVVLDFGGPNVAKPMHVGHIRSALLGDALQRIHRFCGDTVISDVHLGDWGTQMGMLIEEIKLQSPQLVYFDENYTGEYPTESPITVQELAEIYPRASKRCKSDINEMEKARLATFELQQGRRGYVALWQHFVRISIDAVKKDFDSLDVHFDLWLGESDANKFIDEMISYFQANNFIYEDEGAWVIDTNKDGVPPLIVIKKDGGVMYGTTDLATLWQRSKDLDPDEIIYVVDKRQSLHFKQVFSVAERTKVVSEKCKLKHVAFGTVNGKDGRPFKTREGGVMHLADLISQAKEYAKNRMPDENDDSIIDQIAMATIKFGDLINNYANDYFFDLEKFAQHEGKTGPYLLYTVVRAKSILRKIFGDNYDIKSLAKDYKVVNAHNEYEEKLQLQLIQFPIAVQRAYENSQPHHICEYAYSLANSFNKFYVNCPINNLDDESLKKARIALCMATVKAMTIASDLIGISIPERM
ncbi:arginine--tRNA ligase [Francisella tularensis]|uniref:Arginine--tRNA ligase n=10 Tax=Gammaproteobacteria TaxID=1236 RepID=SYR_FRATH|nr:arginine--tRNA ligase [Francisella tularensis]A7NDV6.1 RecName: Full=Arginine--tRNA ligase; AltName: Full=Arginyl-tRNA synthetase; Short=ArgRS [Francisella tularensis subsp. holarctica FTNF002-00]Q0BKP4.1 RecName: Full=Arginine--tRNA ligase; AltName: Full=Arginyl-tRNA synthetase; Short=ArgRS [Francisella tularensis subsp. holarctica OSU18]Q2A215.1 RecName: Full=Arginine--tRNA ligase; AltName: Full=Arginyl-tRNA synthetase; Short=ArgRS [Francisella tularensis subsp. holarctica LVS]AFX71218.1 a